MNPERIYHLFEIGTKSKQEDYIWPVAGKATQNDKVFIVCDGAGSFFNGGIASKLICQFMAAKVLKFSEQRMSGELIDKLLVEARDRLITYARENRLDTDLTTTFSMLVLYDEKVLVSWCGNSRIYHLRDGEIIFKTEDNSSGSEPKTNAAVARGIKADGSPIHSETKWIEDVQDGDYFLLCSRGMLENVSDDNIKLLVSQNDKANTDLSGSFRRLVIEKAPDNYSMYLLRVNTGRVSLGTQRKSSNNGVIENRKKTGGMVSPIFILAMTIVGLLIMVIYFRMTRPSVPESKYKNQTTQPVDALHHDSAAGSNAKTAPRNQSVDVLRDDTVPSAIVMSAPRKQAITVTDSVKSNIENPQIPPKEDNSSVIQAEEKPEQPGQPSAGEKKRMAQLMIKLTTDESCKLRITNTDLDEVIDWDLSPNDNGTIYLKPGKYSIVATSVVSSTKIKTYNFDVKPGYTHVTQNLNIKF